MELAETIAGMRPIRQHLVGPVGFVPTMGYLHDGHLALVKRAKTENTSVVVSIFVNPTQFGPQEDLASYPRDTQRDLALLEKEKTDVVFMPSADEMYPPGAETWVEVTGITKRLEGASRPTHFRGVTTVVAKLFNIVQPDRAYFGQKDAQQVTVIRKMVVDLNMPLEIITCPTVRESDGLAMSSRNTYLSPRERRAAVVLNQALRLTRESWAHGEKDTEKLRRLITDLIRQQPLAAIDYVSIADTETLEELNEVKPSALVSLAVKIGNTRLIDNVVLE
ncbi:MAG: pantoate--beta-alanine ligase [Dehalococcoidales bacterium]|nr:pantoate--beta-alanine ligase [Dehalococcoidales bacterium]